MIKQDRRFEKTENAIQKSFLQLMMDKPCSNISVKEICQQAQISRNAFYQHYETKEHLYMAIQTDILRSIEEACQPLVDNLADITEVERRKFIDNILIAVDRQKDKIYHLLNSQAAYFSSAFCEMLIKANIKSSQQFPEPVDPASIHVFSGAVSSYISFWLLETNLTLLEAQEQLYNILENFGS